MENKKVLLRIKNLKQYFPVKGHKNLFVKANDGISIDIYEGETLGLVGESGCGKSTFGRVLLQLYHQTHGRTLFYGKTLSDVVPRYVITTLKNIESLNSKMLKLNEERDALQGKTDEISIKKYKNVAEKAENAFLDLVQIIGGFIVASDLKTVANVFLEYYNLAAERKKLRDLMLSQTLAKDELLAKKASADKIKAVDDKISSLQSQIEQKTKEVENKKAEIEKVKQGYLNNQKFMEYDKYRDEGVDLARLTYPEVRHLRSDVQLIFQDPYSSLNPRMTVGQIIGEALFTHKYFETSNERAQKYITDVMVECGLAPYMFHRYPHQFSGGQRQRICIARSLAVKPKFVVCDEAVSALDVSIQSQIINLLRELKEKENLTYLFISHDLSVIKYISDRVGVMYLGNIVELAPCANIFDNPRHPYTEALLSAIPTTDTERKKETIILEGDIPSPVNPPPGCKFHTRCSYCMDKCKEVTPQLVEIEPNHFVACHLRTE